MLQFAGEIFFRQRRALVGREGFLADQGDVAGKAALAQALRRFAAGLARADDDDAVDIVRHERIVFGANKRAGASGP